MQKERKHVFVSHSNEDDVVGRRLCAALEKEGIRCWNSSRPSDLEPGSEWDDNIVAALDDSAAVVLLFSAAANGSRWVKRELGMAWKRQLRIYPIRIENIQPTGGMEAHLTSVQWTDAFSRDIEDSLSFIVAQLRPTFPLPDPADARAAAARTIAGGAHAAHVPPELSPNRPDRLFPPVASAMGAPQGEAARTKYFQQPIFRMGVIALVFLLIILLYSLSFGRLGR